MGLSTLAAISLLALAAGYVLYGRRIARKYRLDGSTKTPAEEFQDGVDFLPTKPFYLLGQHFSAIAAAGPIAGPILACAAFGWLPCLLWIVLGAVFIGAAHDFSALVASVRHRGRSIVEVVRENLGPRAGAAMLGFTWITLVYVIVAFTDITAGTFRGMTEELQGVPFNPGGAVAASATLYLLLAVVMGLLQKHAKLPLWPATLLFVPATLGAVWAGTRFSTLLILDRGEWVLLIMAYCGVASFLPAWFLLQPRGYLGGFILYLALAIGIAGIFFGGFPILQPATTSAPLAGLEGSLFPFLFVTIACGACSGFHGLVCAGTTSKQIARETHCLPVGYGTMLLEALVAIIAMATIMTLTPEQAKGVAPGKIYGDGLARFITAFLGPEAFVFAATFGAMAFSTFVFDTLDVATRLGRLIFQELGGLSGKTGAVVGTAVTVGAPLLALWGAGDGGWRTFWILFGTSNQLLAGLTLLGITVWLRRSGRPFWFTAIPMVFILSNTLWSLIGQAIGFFKSAGAEGTASRWTSGANGAVSVLLMALTLLVIAEGTKALRTPQVTKQRG